MRALILCLALAACGLEAAPPEPSPCPSEDYRLVRARTLDGVTEERCVPIQRSNPD